MKIQNSTAILFNQIAAVIQQSRQFVYRSSNTQLLNMYREIGQLIIVDEQKGKHRAAYGKAVLKDLSKKLTLEFGKGFEESNLRNMRNFYQAFPIQDAVRPELSWTHYRIISRIENEQHRLQYMQEAIAGNWNTRTLQRNIESQYVGRMLKVPQTIVPSETRSFIKDPYIFEFPGIPTPGSFTENDLESALINHIQQFLMELGKGFAFVARQQHISTDTSDFFIDLIFYNYYLKCFVLIDIKTSQLTHEAIGQIDMYVRLYNDLKKSNDDNPTIGIILCTEKDETIVKYSVLDENEKLFASKYRLYLPDEGELKQLIENDRIKFELDND
jgi:predicted nuclease of restriction endonuclease-like (RecB) superfamily